MLFRNCSIVPTSMRPNKVERIVIFEGNAVYMRPLRAGTRVQTRQRRGEQGLHLRIELTVCSELVRTSDNQGSNTADGHPGRGCIRCRQRADSPIHLRYVSRADWKFNLQQALG